MTIYNNNEFVSVKPDNSFLTQIIPVDEYGTYLPVGEQLGLGLLSNKEMKKLKAKKYCNKEIVMYEKDKHFYFAYKHNIPKKWQKDVYDKYKEYGYYWHIVVWNGSNTKTNHFPTETECYDWLKDINKDIPPSFASYRIRQVCKLKIKDPDDTKIFVRLPFKPRCMSNYDIAQEWNLEILDKYKTNIDLCDLIKILETYDSYIKSI